MKVTLLFSNLVLYPFFFNIFILFPEYLDPGKKHEVACDPWAGGPLRLLSHDPSHEGQVRPRKPQRKRLAEKFPQGTSLQNDPEPENHFSSTEELPGYGLRGQHHHWNTPTAVQCRL